MELKIISEAVKFFDAPEFLLLASMFILWAHKKIREHFSIKKDKHTETLLNLVDYIKNNPQKDAFIMEQLFMDHLRVYLPYKGLKLFLNSEEPTQNILNYRLGLQYVCFSIYHYWRSWGHNADF